MRFGAISARELVARVQTHLQMSQLRKEAEEAIRKLAETLESEVRERTKQLEDRNSEVLRQSETVRALSQNLMHVQDDERRHIARELRSHPYRLFTLKYTSRALLRRSWSRRERGRGHSLCCRTRAHRLKHLLQVLLRNALDVSTRQPRDDGGNAAA